MMKWTGNKYNSLSHRKQNDKTWGSWDNIFHCGLKKGLVWLLGFPKIYFFKENNKSKDGWVIYLFIFHVAFFFFFLRFHVALFSCFSPKKRGNVFQPCKFFLLKRILCASNSIAHYLCFFTMKCTRRTQLKMKKGEDEYVNPNHQNQASMTWKGWWIRLS